MKYSNETKKYTFRLTMRELLDTVGKEYATKNKLADGKYHISAEYDDEYFEVTIMETKK